MTNAKPRVGVLYWGARGGGKVLAEQLVEAGRLQGYKTTYFSRPARKDGTGRSIPIYFFWDWMTERRRIVSTTLNLGITVMVLPMASPWDLFIGRSLRRRGVRVSRIIHDASPHPGDIFPSQIWIRMLCSDATLIITLSNYVGTKLLARGYVKSESLLIGKLPTPFVPENQSIQSNLPRTKFLFIGRGRRYKGLDSLLTSWPMVGSEDSQLTVAGQGHNVPSDTARVIHIDRWLSDAEILAYISECDVVVLPYSEASQSGLIPIAHSLERPVIVTPIGGLVEQVTDGIDGIITKNMSIFSLADAMNDAIYHQFDFSQQANQNWDSTLINLCLKS